MKKIQTKFQWPHSSMESFLKNGYDFTGKDIK